MSVEDCEEDCTVYIEQLKSDNPSLKLNAASKITAIAAVLGHNRMRDELIPYIIEIIEQMDNDNQFLVKVGEQMLDLKPFCKDISESYVLIPPLKILAALDQPVVRDRAVLSLQELAKGQSKTFFKKHYYPLIKQMAAEQAYPSRVSVCGLIHICYPHLDPEQQMELRNIFNKLALKEDIPMVRRALAENLQNYSLVVTKDIMRSDGLEIWQKFIQDGIDIVRIKALEIVIVVCKYFKKDEVTDKFVKYMKKVDTDIKSWRIRYALIEAWAKILDYVESSVIKKDIVESFEELLKDAEHEVRSIALLKTPQICKKLSASQSSSVFLPHYERLIKDTSIHVKQAVVESIVPFLNTIEKDKLYGTGISLIEQLFKDEALNVRVGLIQRLKDLNDLLGAENTKKYVIPVIMSCQEDKKWRFRLSVVENLPALYKNLGYQTWKSSLDQLLKGFLKDHYFAVREQTFASLTKLKDAFGSEKTKDIIINNIVELSKEKNFVYRVAAAQALAKCQNALDSKDINTLFLDIAKRYEGEKVPNVLVNILKSYLALKGVLTPQTKKQWFALVRKYKENKDQDVEYYVGKCEDNL